MNNKIYLKSRECYWTITYHCVNECIWNVPFQVCNIKCTVCKMLKRCHQDTKEAMICIDNKYGLIKDTNLHQISNYFSYLSTRMSCLSSVEYWTGDSVFEIFHTQMQYHQSTLEFQINQTQSSCKLIEKCFSCIMRELLNWGEYLHS